MDKIEEALRALFERHRMVFWYDDKREMRERFEALSIPGVEKIALQNDEYAVKYRILRKEPKQRFLIYQEGPQPPDLENWLLDVVLANTVFHADYVSLWMAELDIPLVFRKWVAAHAEFFRAESRRGQFRDALTPEDTDDSFRQKMLSICAGADAHAGLEEILEALLTELAAERDERMKLVRRCALDSFLWDQLKKRYGYHSETPGVEDFAISLFKSGYARSLGEPGPFTKDALIFLKRWRDNIRHRKAFDALSERYAGVLNIEEDISQRDLHALSKTDFFKLIDMKILKDLADEIEQQTISHADCEKIIKGRRDTHWFHKFRDAYEALLYASKFISELAISDLRLDSSSLGDGIAKYAATWFRLDQFYRKFVFYMRASKLPTLFNRLSQKVERMYSNQFLLRLNDAWQEAVDACSAWKAPSIKSQRDFYRNVISGALEKNRKSAVIISDALRYEVAEELAQRVERMDRFTAKLEPMLSALPSYTQLGMAALLPNREITLAEDGTALIDGQSTAGLDNRAKILNAATGGKAVAVRCDDLLSMTRDESRELVKDARVIYIYHNQIDATGDKRETEERVFEATEAAISEIIDIVRKLAGANVSRVIVTSDHGFIFQHHPLDESDFSQVDAEGEEIYFRNRRYVVGRNLKPSWSVKFFRASDLGLSGDFEVLIPKSINRLRLKGSGSRFVHGGAALQEVVLPLLTIHKKRVSDVSLVDVEILTRDSAITTGQLSVTFYQTEPVSPKRQPRELRAGIYTKGGKLISDLHALNFDEKSENPRDREKKVRFLLTKDADEVKNEDVILKLEEKVPGTSYYKEYRSRIYKMRRSITTDFDL